MSFVELSEILGNFGEIIGALLLFASLIYVGRQIKQNTEATKAQIHQGTTMLSEQFNLAQASNAELSDLWLRAVGSGYPTASAVPYNEDALNDVERQQFLAMMNALKNRCLNSFYQHQHGFLDHEFYEASAGGLIRAFGRIWIHLDLLSRAGPAFNAEVQRLLDE
jgi:hypothetical protein